MSVFTNNLTADQKLTIFHYLIIYYIDRRLKIRERTKITIEVIGCGGNSVMR